MHALFAFLSLSDQGSGSGAVVSAHGKAFDSAAVAPLPSTASLKYLTEIESAPATRSETKLSFTPPPRRAERSCHSHHHDAAPDGPFNPYSSPRGELLHGSVVRLLLPTGSESAPSAAKPTFGGARARRPSRGRGPNSALH